MEWHIEVDTGKLERKFGREDHITLWGSCFAEELMQQLYRELYSCSFSPFGISYNPIAMGEALEYLFTDKAFTAEQLIEHRGLWHSLMHHGKYSMPTPEATLQNINDALQEARAKIAETKLWVFTFGTAYIYEWAEPPYQVVNNCHRLPASRFVRRRVPVEQITLLWVPLLRKIVATGAEVVLTVSPIPHYRDGVHHNRLSKATLLLAVEELVNSSPKVHYFPSYEIQLDELRDYRFYKEDMAHPTEQAVQYILERFTRFAIERDDAFEVKWQKLRDLMGHRPLSNDPTQVTQHYMTLRDKILRFQEVYPHPYLQDVLNSIDQKR